MAGALDQSEEKNTCCSAMQAGHDWFSDNSELAALTGPAAAARTQNLDGPKIATHADQVSTDAHRIASDADRREIANDLSQGVHSFDLLQLFAGDKRVAFFGERHDDLGQKNEIIKNLKSLKEHDGLTHVALEMLNSDDMPSVRQYFAGTGSREAVLDRLKARWSIAPGVPEKYMEMIEAIKDARLIPLALDKTSQGRDDSAGTLFQDRNRHWAETVDHVIAADAKAKVLVYSGRDHVGYSPANDHANEILKNDFGVNSTVVMFTSTKDKSNTLSGRVAWGAVHAQLDSKQFAFTLDPASTVRPGDIVLHAPN